MIFYKNNITSIVICIGTSRDIRDDEFFDIYIFGGSTVTMGNPNLPKLLQKIAKRKRNKKIRFFNIGTTSSNVNQDFIRLIMDVSDYDPELVVFYGGGNEIIHADRRVGYPHGFQYYESNPYSMGVEEFPTLDMLILSSAFLRKIFRDRVNDAILARSNRFLEDYRCAAPLVVAHRAHCDTHHGSHGGDPVSYDPSV